MRPEEAAAQVAGDFGLRVDEPTVLRDTNNVVAWLAPSPVVAKIGTGHRRRLEDELAAGRLLKAAAAPVVGPSALLPPLVHLSHGHRITFWEYRPETGGDPSAVALALALRGLHASLAQLLVEKQVPLPSFSGELTQVGRKLRDPDFAPALYPDGRQMLLDALSVFRLDDTRESAVLHGSPHRFNILSVDGEPYFIDFETICLGPIEWDLAHLDASVSIEYPDSINETLLTGCRRLVSVKTATWCWANVEYSEDMRWHAEHHLGVVREALG